MKHDLKDITFTIPVRIDSKDRFDNIHYIIDYLTANFDTNIIVFENGHYLFDERIQTLLRG